MSVDDYKDKHHGSMRRWEPRAGNDLGVGRAYPHPPAPEVGRQSWGWQCGLGAVRGWTRAGSGNEAPVWVHVPLGLGLSMGCQWGWSWNGAPGPWLGS